MKRKKSFVNQHEYASFMQNALALNGSVTPKVIGQVGLVVLYSCFVSWLHYLLPSMALPIGPFEYAGLIMGLILVFRINSGYDRWWEARKIWGNLVNHSRNLVIIVLNYASAESSHSHAILSYITAMPFVMKYSLRGDNRLQEVQLILDEASFLKLTQSTHPVNCLSSMIAGELQMLRNASALDGFAFMQAEEKRAMIVDCQGACERILNTPMPFVMAAKSRQFIFLFLLMLPFALVDTSIFFSPVVTGLVSYAFFSLDQIGIELQYPFSEDRLSHLPLSQICRNIQDNIENLRHQF
jgi:putative membrane protein